MQSKPLLGCVSFRLLQRTQPAEITAPSAMTIPDEFITSPALSVHGCDACAA